MAKVKRRGKRNNRNNNQRDNQNRAGDAVASGQGGAGVENVRDEVVEEAVEEDVEGVDAGKECGDVDGLAEDVEALGVGENGAKKGEDGGLTNEGGGPRNNERRFWEFEGSGRTKPKSPEEVHEFEHQPGISPPPKRVAHDHCKPPPPL